MTLSVDSETKTDSGFICDCEDWMRSACSGEPFYREHEGKRYCVLHFPGGDKAADFANGVRRKTEKRDFDFRGVWFPDEQFFDFDFDAAAHFGYATFTGNAYFVGVSFSQVDFTATTFQGKVVFDGANFEAIAHFAYATFNAKARFREANFVAEANFAGSLFVGAAAFNGATFNGKANFYRATFNSDADFSMARFDEAMFDDATFKNSVRFAGDERYAGFAGNASLVLRFARIEKPQEFVFHTLLLWPSWFVNTDTRNFEFTNVDWVWRNTQDEITSLREKDVSLPHRMLSIACRHLAVNAEDNHRYEEASKFRFMAMDARRLEHWRGFDFRRLSWWYWLASGYGERVLQASIVFVGILLISAVLYTLVGFRWERTIAPETTVATSKREDVVMPIETLPRALIYSAAVMTLQKPEPRPATTAAQTIVLLEAILGPVQAALLALAIRRKFMR